MGLVRISDLVVFKKKLDSGLCKTLGKTREAEGGNTTNLLSHLKSHHPKLYIVLSEKVFSFEGNVIL